MQETICALASGPPPSGIAVIRISGPGVKDWLTAHVSGGPLKPRYAHLRKIHDADLILIDEALVFYMPGPNSYTGEDTAELSLHGGPAVIAHALRALTETGAIRLAHPGEFTRRAFQNDRLDLTQAEAIADLIEAETQAQKAQAFAQKDGALSRQYLSWRTLLLEALALVEVAVDFPDEADAPEHTDGPVQAQLEKLHSEISEALSAEPIHERVRDGFKVAIIGAPNVGKSTLLNHFAGREAAIVTDQPGTTRDIIEVRCRLGGHIVWFADTAGLRDTADEIEAEGIRRAVRSADEADLRIFVFDEDTPPPSPLPLGEMDLWVRNKVDQTVNDALTREIISVSALHGTGMKHLISEIESWIQNATRDMTVPIITRARHRQQLQIALENLRAAQHILADHLGAELAAEALRQAARALSALIGAIDVEEVLGAVFSEFCIGK